MKIILSVFAAVLVLVGAFYALNAYIYNEKQGPAPSATSILSFADCERAGYPVMESYPRQCRTPDGRTFAEELPETITYVNASADRIVIDLPYPGAVTGKEFKVTGKARGNWFFEASFPIEVKDQSGKTIATGIATANGEWMTEDFVPFTADIQAPASFTGPATLVLHRDNASGLPEHDASASFPITIEY